MTLTVATIDKVALAPIPKFPIVQVGADQAPNEGVALTKLYPAGIISETLTPVAGLGPPLVAVIVKVILLPIIGVLLLAIFVTPKSACGTGTGVTVDVLFVGTVSVSLTVIVAVFS